MTYVSWATFHEGATDAAYLEVLLPRILEDIIAERGIHNSDVPATPGVRLGLNGRAVDDVANEACDAKDAFEIIFIHADTGGRGLAETLASRSASYCQRMYEICQWPTERCVQVAPRHETEAWVLADPSAVLGALGYNGDFRELGLPKDAAAAERLVDPKATLDTALGQVAGPRRRRARVEQLFPAIAQRQELSQLRRSSSYQNFEAALVRCLQHVGCIE